MTEVNFEPGTPVCYKCGSPTFLVVKTESDNQTLVLSWFDESINKPKTFRVPKVLIETLEDFTIRKIRLESVCNKFMEKMFTEKADGHVFSKDPKYKLN